MQALNCNRCGRRSWYSEHEWGFGEMVSPNIEHRYYRDAAGQEAIECCPGCGVRLDLEQWEDRPGDSSDYGIVRLLLVWVLGWGVIADGQVVQAAPGKPLARWNEERHCWRVADSASDLEEVSDFAPTQSFGDAWLIIEHVQDEAGQSESAAARYQRFLTLVNERWQEAIAACNLAESFSPWAICYALLDAFEM